MKVLHRHNDYQQRGGEDESFEAEAELLERHGHEVLRIARHNDAIKGRSSVTVSGQALWSRSVRRELEAVLAR